MAAAAAVGIEFSLKPYGINAVITPGFRPSSLFYTSLQPAWVDEVYVPPTGTTAAKMRPNKFHFGGMLGGVGARKTFTYVKLLGKGAHGEAYEVIGTDGKHYAIKRITDDFEEVQDLRNVLQECIIQAIVAETTKGEPNGPYAPQLYHVGWDMDKSQLYICSELLDNKMDNLIAGSTEDVNDVVIPDALIQLSDALHYLHTTYEFNHRDLKADNIMYKTRPDGSYQFRFIDFGLSCMTWNGVKFSGASWWDEDHSCYKVDRDLTQLVYDLVKYKSAYISAALLDRLHKLLKISKTGQADCYLDTDCVSTAAGPAAMSWIPSYNFLNRANVRARGTPSRIKAEMQAFQRGSPFRGTPVAAAVARSPPTPCPLGTIRGPDGDCIEDPAPPGVGGTSPELARAAAAAPAAAAKPPCPSGQIRNPKTGRCVKKTGRVGRKIATNSTRRRRSSRRSSNTRR
jgi:hypothetical protein